MTFRPQQAVALKEAWENGGLFGAIGVGQGKTLITALLPYVLEARRPLLVLPAKLISKTKREWRHLANHWRMCSHVRLISYEWLGRVQAKEELDNYRPDLLMFDEAHKVKNPKAAVTRRFDRHIRARRDSKLYPLSVVALGGTMFSRSLRDCAHIIEWCLPGKAPVPATWNEREAWADAIDELENPFKRVGAGALLDFLPGNDQTGDELTDARAAFRRRIYSTPGVVVTTSSGEVAASIRVEHDEAPPSPAIESALAMVRAFERPDGEELWDAVEVWRYARQVALGFYYIWDPAPPDEWKHARKAWGKFVREQIKKGDYDSELDVARNFPNAPEYLQWCAVRDKFRINTKPVWICDSVLNHCAKWLKDHPNGILWTDHVAFGERLSHLTGLPYFGTDGRDANGTEIELASGPIIASTESNRDGRNLQFKWRDNYHTAWESSASRTEQMMGRTHRDGQEADEVTFTVLTAVAEHSNAFWKSYRYAGMLEALSGPQKLRFADILVPEVDEFERREGPRWQRAGTEIEEEDEAA